MKFFAIVLLLLFLATPAVAGRYTTVTVTSPVISPGGSASVHANINSYHIDVHKISVNSGLLLQLTRQTVSPERLE